MKELKDAIVLADHTPLVIANICPSQTVYD